MRHCVVAYLLSIQKLWNCRGNSLGIGYVLETIESSSGRSTVSSREVRKAAKILALMRRDVAYTKKKGFRLRRDGGGHPARPLHRPGRRAWCNEPPRADPA